IAQVNMCRSSALIGRPLRMLKARFTSPEAIASSPVFRLLAIADGFEAGGMPAVVTGSGCADTACAAGLNRVCVEAKGFNPGTGIAAEGTGVWAWEATALNPVGSATVRPRRT